MRAQFIYVFSLLLLLAGAKCKAQAVANSERLIRIKDRVNITTDRSIYAVGETIQFKAAYNNNGPSEINKWSTVLYVELIKPDGTAIVQKKFSIENNISSGSIVLPNDLYTGVYYVKAYTKWMRNFSTKEYAVSRITLINGNSSYLIDKTESCSASVNSAENSRSGVLIRTNKQVYAPRTLVELSIQAKDDVGSQATNSAVSVVRKGVKSRAFENTKNIVELAEQSSTGLHFLPEIDGLTISGKVLNKQSKQAIENAHVHLILMNDMPYLSAANTSDSGQFYFRLPFLENGKDFFVMSKKEDLELIVEIDEEFCDRSIELCNTKFVLSEEEKTLAYELLVNAKITDSYTSEDTIATSEDEIEELSFYGTPNKVINMGKYIDLPYIEEFIFELVSEFVVTHRKGVADIHTREKNTFSPFPVLVLVDNIPVDLSVFLKLRTNKVERLELIDDAYVLGGLNYSGIINAITVNRDLAGIDLPKNSMFFNYEQFASTAVPKITRVQSDRTPYRPNCLYWNPNIDLGKGESKNIVFYTPDVAGNYQVIVESFDKGIKQTEVLDFSVE